jgi:hypothetical protein
LMILKATLKKNWQRGLLHSTIPSTSSTQCQFWEFSN